MFFLEFFNLLLINSSKYLFFRLYFTLYQKSTVYKYKVQRKPIVKDIHLSLILMLKNPAFFRENSLSTTFSFSQFHHGNFPWFYENSFLK